MPKVGIIMGSDSDLKVMSKAAVMLEKLGIDYEMTIISAHREPDELIEWAKEQKTGNQSYYRRCRNGSSIFRECVQHFCPSGYWYTHFRKESGWYGCTLFNRSDAAWNPVATVAIDGGMNAAILAAKMLAMSDPELLKKLKAYSAEMKETVQAKADRLAEVGYEEYLQQ